MTTSEASDAFFGILWLLATIYLLIFNTTWGLIFIGFLVVQMVCQRYWPLVRYSFNRWVRTTEGRIEAEKTHGKAELIDILEAYKAQKRLR